MPVTPPVPAAMRKPITPGRTPRRWSRPAPRSLLLPRRWAATPPRDCCRWCCRPSWAVWPARQEGCWALWAARASKSSRRGRSWPAGWPRARVLRCLRRWANRATAAPPPRKAGVNRRWMASSPNWAARVAVNLAGPNRPRAPAPEPRPGRCRLRPGAAAVPAAAPSTFSAPAAPSMSAGSSGGVPIGGGMIPPMMPMGAQPRRWGRRGRSPAVSRAAVARGDAAQQ